MEVEDAVFWIEGVQGVQEAADDRNVDWVGAVGRAVLVSESLEESSE